MLQMLEMTRAKITSRDNARLKEARKVRDGKSREAMFVEGLRLAEEAVRSGISIEHCIVREGFGMDERENDILKSLEDRDVDISEADDRSFSSLADTKSPQGIVLICARPRTNKGTFESSIVSDSAKLNLVVLLDRVNNPANLGAVLRTAEAAGVKGVVLTNGSADPFGTKAIRASMGAVFRLPIWTDADVNEVKEFASRTQSTLAAVSAQGSADYTAVDWTVPRIVAFGSEAHGLTNDIASIAAESIRIPMDADVESLNLAVAAGIVLFESRRHGAKD